MKTNRIFLRMLGCFAALSALQGLQAQTPGLSYPVPLDEAHFPDEVFREYVDYYDRDGDGQLSVEECGMVDEIDISFRNITSLEGIEYFYALDSLYIQLGFMTSLDVSQNTALTYLNCFGSYLTSLDVSGCAALTTLECYNNQLTSLDVSQNTALTTLECYYNQLTSLDLSQNAALTDLSCGDNQLTSLDVSQNTALTYLNCFGNDLTSLDVSGCAALTDLSCDNNQLTSLDVSQNTALTDLSCDNNQLTSLDVSQNTALTELNCSYNNLAALDLSRNSSLRFVYAENNYYEVTLDEDGNVDIAAIPGLEADRMTDLQGGRIEGNTLHLDADMLRYHYDYKCPSPSASPSGGYFYITPNNPAYCIPIDKEHFPDTAFRSYVAAYVDWNEDGQLSPGNRRMVTSLYVSGRGIRDLRGIEYFSFLEFLNCNSNQLTSLDLSRNTALTVLNCNSNQLTSLDLSKNTALRGLYCSNNQLTSLDVSQNTALTDLSCDNNQLTSLDLSQNTALYYLQCDYNQLTSLDVSQNTALTYLYCNYNQLTSLDVSQNTALTELYCSGNDLTSLDLSKNTALYYLYCNNNQLTSLDVSQNTALRSLYCSNNHLAALDLSKNSRLNTVNAEQNYHEVTLDEGGNVDIAAIPGLEADRMTDLQGGYIVGNTLHLDADVLRYYYDYKCPNPSAPSGGYFHITTNNHVPIDKEHFPDTAFRSCVAASFDRDEDGKLSPFERSIITDISVPNQGIHDLRGIEYFSFLESLDCSGNQLTGLDLSANTYLQSLDCSNNALANLDLSNLPALQSLNCSNNALLDLDTRSLLALQVLDCSKNQLASLDLFRNASLTSIKADSNCREVVVNQDRQFDISTLPRFERARMEEIEGGSLQGDILTFERDEVRYFYSYNNADPNLPLGEYFHLKAVPEPVPGIALNDTTFPDAVFRGYIAENADTDKDSLLSESEIAGVTGLDVSGMGIRDLRGIGYFTALQSLDCSDNELTSLDLSANTALQTLNAGGNRLDIVLDEDNVFDVSSLPGFEMAKASDWTGCTRIGNKLTFTQQEVTYAYATGYSGSSEDASLQSVVFSLFADRDPSIDPNPDPDPDPDPDVANEDADAFQGRVYAKDRTLFTEGISGEVSVYTAVGTLVYKGYATEIPVPASGVYIVRNSSQAWKILVM